MTSTTNKNDAKIQDCYFGLSYVQYAEQALAKLIPEDCSYSAFDLGRIAKLLEQSNVFLERALEIAEQAEQKQKR